MKTIFFTAGISFLVVTALLNTSVTYSYTNPQIVKSAATEERKDTNQEPPELSTEEMIAQAFSDPRTAIAIAKSESGLNPQTESKWDRMKDGRAFSIGLFQINLTWHKVDGLNCPTAFQGKNYGARVVNEELYQECVSRAKDPQKNIDAAKRLPFTHWSVYNDNSYLKNL